MISIQINDVKGFMGHLLSKDTFDSFYLVEASIKKEISYHIDGHIHTEYYDGDDAEDAPSENELSDYCLWRDVRPLAFDIIKGRRLPLGLKIVLALPGASVSRLVRECRCDFSAEDIEGIYLNLYYEPTGLFVTTGISYRRFSPDKRLDTLTDDRLKTFLKQNGIS